MTNRPSRDQLAEEVESLRQQVAYMKELETRLATSEALHRTILDAAPQIIWQGEADGAVSYINRAWEDIIGMPAEEGFGSGWASVIHPDDAPGLLAKWERAYAYGESYSGECRFKTKDGSYRTFDFVGVPVRDDAGKVVRWVGIDTDITDRKQAETLLRNSEERYRSIFESAIMSHVVDDQGRIIDVNETELQKLRCSRREIIGKPFLEIIHPRCREDVAAKFSDVRSGQALTSYETTLLAKDGTEIPVLVNVAPQMVEGTFRCASAILQDITGHKRLQEQLLQSKKQLEESNEALEIRVIERTEEIESLSGKLAHVSRITTMGELVGSIAHELNQPLTAVLANAQAALRFIEAGNPDVQEIRETLQDIIKDDMRANQVIVRLRTLLEKRVVQKERIQLDELVKGLLPLVRSAALDAKARITIESAPNLSPVEADPVQLQQVVMNLLKNAIDAVRSSGSNGGDIGVTLSSVREKSIMVAIRDDGQGIPAENIGEVFGAFFTTKPEGLGMGLSVCKTIIEAHGGTISVENLVPRGCSVTFVLPLGSTPTLCSDAVPAARPADSR